MPLFDWMERFISGPTGQEIITQDAAYASNAITGHLSFTQYNPDDLLGRAGYKVYKLMMIDEQVKAVVRFHRDAVTGRSWSFQDNKLLSDGENEKRRIILTGIIQKMPGTFKTRLDMIMSSIYNGFSLVEKTFDLIEVEGTVWVGIKKLSLKPFNTFYFNLDDFGNLLSLEQQVGGFQTSLDIHKFIHHVQNADVHEYFGQSELREAYRAWYSKDLIIKMQNIWIERSAAGFTYVQPKEGHTITTGSTEYNALVSLVNGVRSSCSMILPSNIELKMEHPNDTQAFDRAIQQNDKAIAKALLMPNLLGLSEQGPNGSRALGDTQLEAFLWMLDAEAASLEETINEQLFQDLATQNFPDGLFPRWTLDELSDKKTMEIMERWTALVEGNAVKPITTDEDHIRSSLKFPPVDRLDDDEVKPVDPETALDGVQVTSMMEVIDRVAKEKIPRDSGIQILLNSYPINIEQAEAIMGEVGKSFKPKESVLPGLEQGQEQGQEQKVDENGLPIPPPLNDNLPPSDSPLPNETIQAGRRLNITMAEKAAAAANRVAFAVIDKKSEAIQVEYVKNFSDILLEASLFITAPILKLKEVKPDDARGVEFKSSDISKVRKAAVAMLRESWSLGMKHSKDEISRAKGSAFKADFARLDEQATEFFDNKGFNIAGNLTNDMVAETENILSNAIKTSADPRAVVDDIYEAWTREGFISPEAAQLQMQRLLGVEGKTAATARLNTVVRTNMFEAINEARYSYFTDPELDGFVEALEYSAILDGRTTAICTHLDGRIFPIEGEEWGGQYRPPNHFNCRSVLIPITTFDVWSASETPTQNPQEGFR